LHPVARDLPPVAARPRLRLTMSLVRAPSLLRPGRMKPLMKEAVNKVFTVLMHWDDAKFLSALLHWGERQTVRWDEPELLAGFIPPE
jgi:hypothetical protein